MKKFFVFIFLVFQNLIEAREVIHLSQEQVCKVPYSSDAILRTDSLFVDDFWILHSVMRMAQPQSVFEIGTCTGEGTLIIKNAIGEGIVYSLDLPPGESSYDLKQVGEKCFLPYVQVIGDSLSTSYSDFYPIDAWFIDGAHDYLHVFYETKQALKSNPSLIVWHDADITEVYQAIQDALDNSGYLLFRVDDTRIAFSIPKSSTLFALIYD